MALRTAFTELFGLRHPVALAPMGGSAGGALTSAVSAAGGLGLLGGGNGNADWLARELPLVAGGPPAPWGVGFQCWAVGADTVERALEYRPDAVLLSFGDPVPLAGPVRAAGARLIIQVTTLAEARQAVDLGRRRHRGAGHGGGRARRPARLVHAGVRPGRRRPGGTGPGARRGRDRRRARPGRRAGARRVRRADRHPVPRHRRGPDRPGGAEGDHRRGRRGHRARLRAGHRRRLALAPRVHRAHLAPPATTTSGGTGKTSSTRAQRRRPSTGAAWPAASCRGPNWASQAIDLITGLRPAADLVADIAAQAQDALTRALGR